MKVTNHDTAALSGASQAAQATGAGSTAARAKTAVGQRGSDYAQLSSLSEHLKSLTAEGRQAHVDGIGSSVAAGHYKPDSGAISDRMIEHSMSNHAA